jgi:hypothetical protein
MSSIRRDGKEKTPPRPSTGGRGLCLEIQPTVVALPWRGLDPLPMLISFLSLGGDAIEREEPCDIRVPIR